MTNNYGDLHYVAAILQSSSHGVHAEHIQEYLQMIEAAIPGIKKETKEEVFQELEQRSKMQGNSNQNPEVKVQFDEKGLIRQIRNAFRKAFK